ncbi:MAG: hypothetical protein HFI33_09450 [Lachnospiraceae bacterium]|nr:hypothetical protein [Lachnospiraceae bacterium]
MTAYVKRVQDQTPTKLWVNNPLPEEVEEALAFDVFGATTNPTYLSKLMKAGDQGLRECMGEFVKKEPDDDRVMEELQKAMIKRLAEKLLPLFRASNGQKGFVAIQGNPHYDRDADYIYEEALRYFEAAPNIIVKMPGTQAGHEAFERLVAENKPLIVTQGFTMAQSDSIFQAYRRASLGSGYQPPMFMTTLTGIFDQFTAEYTKKHHISVTPEVLSQAGCLISHRVYQYWKEKHAAGVLMGGGARGIQHFTEMVGGAMHVTVNYSFIEELNELNLDISNKMDAKPGDEVVWELLEKLPYFRQAWEVDAQRREDFENYEPFLYFESSFLEAWDLVQEELRAERRG